MANVGNPMKNIALVSYLWICAAAGHAVELRIHNGLVYSDIYTVAGRVPPGSYTTVSVPLASFTTDPKKNSKLLRLFDDRRHSHLCLREYRHHVRNNRVVPIVSLDRISMHLEWNSDGEMRCRLSYPWVLRAMRETARTVGLGLWAAMTASFHLVASWF